MNLILRVILALFSAAYLSLAMFIPDGGLIRPRHHLKNTPALLAHIQTDKQVYRSLDHVFIEIFFSDPVTKRPIIMNLEHISVNLKVILVVSHE